MDVGREGNCMAAAMQAHLVGLPCIVQDALCAGGLASINVCADTNISVPLQGHNAAACAAMQQLLCLLLWKSLQPSLQAGAQGSRQAGSLVKAAGLRMRGLQMWGLMWWLQH